jgi:Tol biopolymer transport system component
MPLPGGTRLGTYEIVAALGAGGMGEVYRAKDTKLGRDVALKILPASFTNDPERVARFRREAQVLASLNHPHIAQIYGLEEANGTQFLVLELVDGESLDKRIARGPIPIDEALGIAKQIAEALEAAHEKGIIHRDLKPANIALTQDGNVKVLDFGLAKAVETTAGSVDAMNSPTITSPAMMTGVGVILGTAAYMSPEQAKGRPADKRSDMWAFGCVLYEMITGKRAFEGEDVSDTLAAVLRSDPDWQALPRVLPTAVATVLNRCLRKDRRQRFSDMSTPLFLLNEATEVAPSSGTLGAQQRSWFKRALPVLGGAMMAVLVTALVDLSFFRPRVTPPESRRVRYQITPPEDNLLYFSLSADGRFLAFLTADGNNAKIWVRALESLETRLLTATQSIATGRIPSFFWSPDGAYLAFSSQGKLYKIARTGGPPVPVCDMPIGGLSGGTWRDDGVILFSAQGSLYRVAASGGASAKLAGQEAQAVGPIWLGGERFLYSADGGIFTGSVEGDKPRRILSNVISNVAYVRPSSSASPGYLLFRSGDTLMAQPLDPQKADRRGEAFPVADGVGDFNTARRGAFSASANGVLVFGHGVSRKTELVWVDRFGKRLQTVSRPFALAANPAIRLSPDDTRAIVPVVGATDADLWIADLNRKSLSRLTADGSTSGIWSPDGRSVLWAARDGSRYLRPADGSGKDELLFKNPRCPSCYPYDWSSLGQIAFADQGQNIGMLNAEGDHKPYLYDQSRFAEVWAQISPDGRWMAYISDSPGQREVIVESIPAGKRRSQISTEGGDWPVWRRDGKELFFRQGSSVMAAPIRLTESAVESGKPQALFEVPLDTRFQVSRDGQRFLIAFPIEQSAGAEPLTVDTDWRAGLNK